MNEIVLNDCPFCLKSEGDYYLQSNNFAAIYNISPIVPGHSLVIPKRHVESFFWLKKEELLEFTQLGRRAAQLLSHVFQTDAFDWAIQEGKDAGQSVVHLHLHVIPRLKNDLAFPGAWYQELEKAKMDDVDAYKRFRLSEVQLRELTDRLKAEADSIQLSIGLS